MFQADITVDYADGSRGGKVIYASSREQVMDDAFYFVTQQVTECRETDNKVVEYKVKSKVSKNV
jgi:hypothetical protein